jgi:branched-subunit amino acid transport protein
MSTGWIVVAAVGAVTIVFKAAGPLVVGRRQLRGATLRVVELLAPVMLTALVVSQTFSGGDGLVVDWRLPGVAAGVAALLRGVPLVPAMALAAVVTAALRAVA